MAYGPARVRLGVSGLLLNQPSPPSRCLGKQDTPLPPPKHVGRRGEVFWTCHLEVRSYGPYLKVHVTVPDPGMCVCAGGGAEHLRVRKGLRSWGPTYFLHPVIGS